jgi:hypothetical protein
MLMRRPRFAVVDDRLQVDMYRQTSVVITSIEKRPLTLEGLSTAEARREEESRGDEAVEG